MRALVIARVRVRMHACTVHAFMSARLHACVPERMNLYYTRMNEFTLAHVGCMCRRARVLA